MKDELLNEEQLKKLNSKKGLVYFLRSKNKNPSKVIELLEYEEELRDLQVELNKMQNWIKAKNQRVAIIFEGRDAAGKGGAIRRFIQHLNPRSHNVVALPKPTDLEKGQWYFQRYITNLPNEGEIVFFDRSWYNRAVVEPVNGFCTQEEYELYMQQVNSFEEMLHNDGVILIKFWFSISKEEQAKRLNARKEDPLKQWKLGSVDMKAQDLWESYTNYKRKMFDKTNNSFNPWIIVKANNKKKARLESIRYVLNRIPYNGKEDAIIKIKPNKSIVASLDTIKKEIDN